MKKVIIFCLSLISFSSFAGNYDDLKSQTRELAAKTLIFYENECEREVSLVKSILTHHFTLIKIQDKNVKLISHEVTSELQSNIAELKWIINLNTASLDLQLDNLKNSNCSNDRFLSVMQEFEDAIIEFNKTRDIKR